MSVSDVAINTLSPEWVGEERPFLGIPTFPPSFSIGHPFYGDRQTEDYQASHRVARPKRRAWGLGGCVARPKRLARLAMGVGVGVGTVWHAQSD